MTADRLLVGFVILSHESDGRLARLIGALDREYDAPPVVVHHDFSQAPLNRSAFPPNVTFVERPERTGWAKWSVVAGARRALRQLYDDADPDWFFLLSASDYPTMSGAAVRAELDGTACDAFIDARPLDEASLAPTTMLGAYNPKLDHFASADNRALKRRFALSRQWWVPIVRLTPRVRLGKLTYRPPLEARHPYGQGFACFYGDHWFTANRRASQVLLAESPHNRLLQQYLSDRTQPDESYYATMLANAPTLTLCRDNRRFAEWNGGGAHPMIMTDRQAEEAVAAKAFFARKMPDDAAFAARMDEMLSRPGRER